MPSPCAGQYYLRKGGKYRKRGHKYIDVGSGNGNYSKRNRIQDRKRRATKSKKFRGRYPQEYD